jgi:hypothetical protein
MIGNLLKENEYIYLDRFDYIRWYNFVNNCVFFIQRFQFIVLKSLSIFKLHKDDTKTRLIR